MADHRPLLDGFDLNLPFTKDELGDGFQAPLSLLTRSRQFLRLIRKFLIPLLATPLIVILLLRTNHNHESTSSTGDSSHMDLRPEYLDYLSSPLVDYEFVNKSNPRTYIVGEHHPVQGDFPKDYRWIDPDSKKPFKEVTYRNGMNNNAMGRMPAGSPYDVLVIGRGRSNKYTDPTEHIPYLNLTIVGFFANYNATTGQWHRAGPLPHILDLPVWRQYPRPCSNLVNGGPADPRFLWSDAGEPLAIVGTSSRVPGVCKAIGVVDLRAVWPDLKQHLEDIGYGDIPIKFNRFIEVGKETKKTLFEKNWAAFFPGPKPAVAALSWFGHNFKSWRSNLAKSSWPLFATQIKLRTILQVNETLDVSLRSPDAYVLANEIDLSSRINDTLSFADSKCLINSLPKQWNQNALHQATPFYRVTFCARGSCIPSSENTVLLGLIHYKRSHRSYRRMFVTMSTEAPFKILSVSPPLHFGTVASDRDVVFSVSLAFLPTKDPVDLVVGETPFRESQDPPGGYLNHGWLDDTIVVGSGLRDALYDGIHLPVSAAMHGHKTCS